jgi:2-phospho-L-lactate transferase/gluconeogenesis factor (CofD/UPF0052 family)
MTQGEDTRMTILNRGQREPNIVVIGGGTGAYTALMGLKHHTRVLAAIISMADSGGSTGRLRDEFGHLPPGDVRKALVALAPDDDTSLILRKLFEYRFEKGDGLSGHTFGNLFLTALTEITGSLDMAIAETSHILNIRGRVIPVTLTDTHLVAETVDGHVIRGETNIDVRTIHPELPLARVYLEPGAEAHAEAVRAIEEADIVVIGPGDLYSSLLPNLLVRGIPGETDGYRASDFTRQILQYLGSDSSIDYVLANYHERLDADVLRRYAADGSVPVGLDLTECYELVPEIRVKPLTKVGAYVRHDSHLLADAVMEIYRQHKTQRIAEEAPAPA